MLSLTLRLILVTLISRWQGRHWNLLGFYSNCLCGCSSIHVCINFITRLAVVALQRELLWYTCWSIASTRNLVNNCTIRMHVILFINDLQNPGNVERTDGLLWSMWTQLQTSTGRRQIASQKMRKHHWEWCGWMCVCVLKQIPLPLIPILKAAQKQLIPHSKWLSFN